MFNYYKIYDTNLNQTYKLDCLEEMSRIHSDYESRTIQYKGFEMLIKIMNISHLPDMIL